MNACQNPYADFERRMIAEWEKALQAAAEAGDEAAFLAAEQELATYRQMLKDSLAACPCGGECDSKNK